MPLCCEQSQPIHSRQKAGRPFSAGKRPALDSLFSRPTLRLLDSDRGSFSPTPTAAAPSNQARVGQANKSSCLTTTGCMTPGPSPKPWPLGLKDLAIERSPNGRPSHFLSSLSGSLSTNERSNNVRKGDIFIPPLVEWPPFAPVGPPPQPSSTCKSKLDQSGPCLTN